ncbi:TniB family NTP-binding protein [uncultured Neisseria sp.]|uniref:TniB family NTP-binding protein n=1 Tax=uncultured Neisseria sp. TaxID=237778 RepID=UPI0025D68875|nr:TniB family NTP-binding protein [uncultured Neisseria sp.]
MKYPHLHKKTATYLDADTEERIWHIRSPHWIGYPQAEHILNKLEDLLVYPKIHRMPNLLIVGDTNNGKTMLAHRFLRKHPADQNLDGDSVLVPVLLVQAPPVPDEGRFYNTILDAIFAPYKSHDRIDKKQTQVIHLLKRMQTRMLIIDEIHHILAGSMNRQRAFLNVIKYLGNDLQIPIVGIGTKDAFRALQTDPQLSNRFEPAVLPRWNLDRNFLRLLVSFERMIPLKRPSELQTRELAVRLYNMSEGYIGELSRVLTEAAATAVQNETEQINHEVLDSIGWVTPTERKWQIDKLA